MGDIDSLIQQLEQNGHSLFWQGGAPHASIDKLESLLNSRLPASFRSFLREYGGGGLDDAAALISGIEVDDPSLEHRGTVYGDTLLCREAHALPDTLVVVYLSDDHAVWCLDVSRFDGDECPVVAYDVFARTIKLLAPTFSDFLTEYLTLRISA